MALSAQTQRQAIGAAIERQMQLAKGATIRPDRSLPKEQLQLDHLLEAERTMMWLIQNRTAVLAAKAAVDGGACLVPAEAFRQLEEALRAFDAAPATLGVVDWERLQAAAHALVEAATGAA